MRAAVLHGARDVRVEDRDRPTIVEPTDALIRLSAACVCGSDLWPYRGQDDYGPEAAMGHEYVGVVEEVGADVTNVEPGQFVIGSFFASAATYHRDAAGSASALLGTARFAFGGIAAPLVGLAGASTAVPLGLVATIAAGMSVGSYGLLRRPGRTSVAP